MGRRVQRRQRLGDRRRRDRRQLDAVDAADAAALYRLLEEEVVPAFYDRDARGVPHRWLAIVKEAIRSVAPRFSARRMVKEYVERMYAPALERKVAAVRVRSIRVDLGSRASIEIQIDFDGVSRASIVTSGNRQSTIYLSLIGG